MNQIKALVYGVSFVSVEGKEYCSVYVGQVSTDTKKYKGIEIMKLDAEPSVFNANTPSFPAECTLTVELKRVSGGKLGQVCTALEPVRAPAPNKSAA